MRPRLLRLAAGWQPRPWLASFGLVILGLAGFLLGSLTGACCYRSDLASLLLRKVLARLQRPGAELGVERIQPRGLGGVTLYGLRFTTRAGPENGGALAVQLEAVQLRWSVSALWAGQLRLTTVELLAPRVSLDMRQGLGTVLRELEPLRALLAARRAGAAPAPQQPGGPAAALPELSIVGGQLELVGLGLGLEDLRLSSRQDADPDGGYLLEGTLRPLGLKGGPCRIAGKLGQGLQQGEVVLDCDTPLTLQREDVALHAPRLRLSIGQSSSLVAEQERERLLLSPALAGGVERLNIAVPSLEVVAPVPGDAQPRPRLFGAVRVVLGEDTMVGVEADLHTPPAGRVIVLGHLLPQQRQVALDLHVEGLDLARSPLPALLPGRLTSGVLDADVAVDLVEHGQRLDVIGRVKVSDVELYHESLTRDPVPFTSLEADVDLAIDLQQRLLVSAASRLLVNRIPLQLDGEVDLGRGPPLVRLELNTGPLAAADLSASVPQALTPRLKLAGLEGTASFQALLVLDMARPEELKLRIEPDVSRLTVASLGTGLEMAHLSRPFLHSWEDEERQELYQMETGPGAEGWTALAEVPPILRTAILAQEDGGFQGHKGFSMLHIKGSLIRNLQVGRFARGASTISMQLARNLFLGREKLISRKLQEVILTWRLEQELEKDQIFELYLNVIEWGVGVFGIRAAAEHYFGKAPSQLSVAECLFLSTAVPRPRAVDRHFLAGKRVSRYHESTIRFMLQLLRQRGHLDDAVHQQALAEVLQLSDPATATSLPNLWETVPHRQGSHQVAPK